MRPLALVLLTACAGSPKRGPVPTDVDNNLVGARDDNAPPEPPAPATPPPTSPTEPAPATPANVNCDKVLRTGNDKHDKGDFAGALESYKTALGACGDYSVHTEMGITLAAMNNFDEAAVHYIAELRGTPAPATFVNLMDIMLKLSLERRKELATIATTPETALRVPEAAYENTWVGHFACIDGRGKPKKGQPRRAGQLDVITYTCPDGVEHQAYFDFSSPRR